jgi:hypothetical protein
MVALLRMDWILGRRLLLRLVPLFLLPLLAANSWETGLLGAAWILALFTLGPPIAQELGPHPIGAFVRALPVSGRRIAAARYLWVLLALAGAGVLALLPVLLSRAFHLPGPGRVNPGDLALGLALQEGLLAAVLCLYLPFHFAVGGERGLGEFALSMAVPACALVAAAGPRPLMERCMELGIRLAGGGPALAAAALALAVLGALSLGISLGGARTGWRRFLPHLLVLASAAAATGLR